MTDRTECLCGRPLRPCPCGDDRCTTCDPGDATTLEQRIADTYRATECRYERDLDHPEEPKSKRKGVVQALAELMRAEAVDSETGESAASLRRALNVEIDHRDEVYRQRDWERRHSREWERIATERGQRLVKIRQELRNVMANCDEENNQ